MSKLHSRELLTPTVILSLRSNGPITLAFALVLSGCNGAAAGAAGPGGGGDSSPQRLGPTPHQQVAEFEKDGKLPRLDRSESVAGSDIDGNGVRDDIDAYLLQRFPNGKQRAAAIQMAKGMQSAVLAGGSNLDASREADRQINNAINCLYSRFDGVEGANNPSAVGHEIEAITSNTKARLRAYLAYNKSLDGTTSSEPEGDTCE